MSNKKEDMGDKLKKTRKYKIDVEQSKKSRKLPGNRVQSGFKLPTAGSIKDQEHFNKRKVKLIDVKTFKNLNKPEKKVIEGSLVIT